MLPRSVEERLAKIEQAIHELKAIVFGLACRTGAVNRLGPSEMTDDERATAVAQLDQSIYALTQSIIDAGNPDAVPKRRKGDK